MWWLLQTDAVTEQKLILKPGILDSCFFKEVRELFVFWPITACKLLVGRRGEVLLILYLSKEEHLIAEELLQLAVCTEAMPFTPLCSSDNSSCRIWVGSSDEVDTVASPLLQ
jgi:hypothetical protein